MVTDWKNLTGKHVKIFLNDKNVIYTGLVLSTGDDYIRIKDKFEKEVFIILTNISSVEVEA